MVFVVAVVLGVGCCCFGFGVRAGLSWWFGWV